MFGHFAHARRLFFETAAFGQSAATQSSITSSNVAKRSRRGPGASSGARNASNPLKSHSAAARSTFRRDPSGNRTHALYRGLPSFHRSDGRCATVDPSPRRSQQCEGYVQSGYVRGCCVHSRIGRCRLLT